MLVKWLYLKSKPRSQQILARKYGYFSPIYDETQVQRFTGHTTSSEIGLLAAQIASEFIDMLEKADLLKLLARCNRGIVCTDVEKQAIEVAIAKLESRNPTPHPLAATDLLEGNWKLLYTTSTELLGIDRVPLVNLGAIYQCIRTNHSRIYNIAEVQGISLLEGIISVVAEFSPVTERRVDVQFSRAIWGLRKPIGYQSPTQFINSIEANQRFRAIDFRIPPRDRAGWLEITYLDGDMRIGRGNIGSVFVLQRVSTVESRSF